MKRLLAYLGKEYGYTPRQSLQLLGLLCLTLAFLAVPLLYKAWLLSQPLGPLPPLELVAIDTASGERQGLASYKEEAGRAPKATVAIRLHAFDPNQAGEMEWQELGTPAWLARRIVHYREKGGRFRRPEDVGRIYDFPPNLLVSLKPYMRFEEGTGAGKTEGTPLYAHSTYAEDHPAASSYPTLNLNEADSAALEALPQLGPATARNIVKYRKLLGGYVTPNQLYELYNQDSTRTAVFLPYLKVYPGEGKTPIDLNAQARKGDLYHPYLPKQSAKLIRAWVREHGNLARPDQLLEHKLIDSASYRKLLPYLAF